MTRCFILLILLALASACSVSAPAVENSLARMEDQLDGVRTDLERVDTTTARAASALDSAELANPGVRLLLTGMNERIASAASTAMLLLAVIAACLMGAVVLLFARCAGPSSATDEAAKAHPGPLRLRILQSAATALVVAAMLWLILYLFRHNPWTV